MTERDDHQLLAEFARNRSEAAFVALVQRHLGLVYSTALRSVGSNHAAEEIAQAVFIILAQKAGKLSPHIVLSGWLYQTTRLTGANFLRGEIHGRPNYLYQMKYQKMNVLFLIVFDGDKIAFAKGYPEPK